MACVRTISRAGAAAVPRGLLTHRSYKCVSYVAAHRARRTSCAAASPSSAPQAVDVQEIGSLLGATAVQGTLITGALFLLQQVMQQEAFPSGTPSTVAVWLFFAFCSLRSRFFGVLDSRRPNSQGAEGKGFNDRKRPKWCPPGITFPIVWSTIALLRATSATLVWEAADHNVFTLPLIAFCLHLCCGDTWNYINNAQGRLGVSATWNTLFIWPSSVAVVALYFQTLPEAGWLLAPMVVWLTVANALVWSIWDLNGRQALLPRVE